MYNSPKSTMNRNEEKFFDWVKENPDHKWPHVWNIAEALNDFPNVDSLAGLFKEMQKDSWFEIDDYVATIETWNDYWIHIAEDTKIES
jgi:hypothetical protein